MPLTFQDLLELEQHTKMEGAWLDSPDNGDYRIKKYVSALRRLAGPLIEAARQWLQSELTTSPTFDDLAAQGLKAAILRIQKLEPLATPSPWVDDNGYRAKFEDETLFETKHSMIATSYDSTLIVELRNVSKELCRIALNTIQFDEDFNQPLSPEDAKAGADSFDKLCDARNEALIDERDRLKADVKRLESLGSDTMEEHPDTYRFFYAAALIEIHDLRKLLPENPDALNKTVLAATIKQARQVKDHSKC